VLATTPLFFALREHKKNVFLASLTSTDDKNMKACRGTSLTDLCKEVRFRPVKQATESTTTMESSASTSAQKIEKIASSKHPTIRDEFPDVYFHEYHLSQYYHEKHDLDVPVYTICQRGGTRGVTAAYASICERLNIDTVIMLDVGIDSVCFGREPELGTPSEDMMSIAAVHALPATAVHTRVLICFGVGIEPIGEVNFLYSIAQLQRAGGFIGSLCLVSGMREATYYCDVVRYCGHSHLNGTIAASVLGSFGDVFTLPTGQTCSSPIFAHTLSQLLFFFDLSTVAARIEYLPLLTPCDSKPAVQLSIARWREQQRLTDGHGRYIGPQRNVSIPWQHPDPRAPVFEAAKTHH